MRWRTTSLGAVDGSRLSPVGTGFALTSGRHRANNQACGRSNPINGGWRRSWLTQRSRSGHDVQRRHQDRRGRRRDHQFGNRRREYEGVSDSLLAFGFEGIANTTDRIAVMDRVLDWLQGFPEIVHTPLTDTEDTSNPYTVKALITSEHFQLAPATFAVVYSANGGADMSVPMTATGNPDEYQAAIPAQPTDTEVAYRIAASTEEHTSTHPLGAPGLRHLHVAKDTEPAVIVHVPFSDQYDLTGRTRSGRRDHNVGVEAVYFRFEKRRPFHRMEMGRRSTDGDSRSQDRLRWVTSSTTTSFAMDESTRVRALLASGAHHFSIVERGTPRRMTAASPPATSAINLTRPWARSGERLGDDPGRLPEQFNANWTSRRSIAADQLARSRWHCTTWRTPCGGNVRSRRTTAPPGGGDISCAATTESHARPPWYPRPAPLHEYQGVLAEDLFDPSAYAGEQVIIRLHFGSDGSIVHGLVRRRHALSVSVDEAAPSISNVVVPKSSFNTSGPYAVSATVRDLFSGIANVTLYYNVDGGSYTAVSMSQGTGDTWNGNIPGQPAGSRMRLYVAASDNAGNETVNPVGAPASTYGFSILPSADILVLDYSTSGARWRLPRRPGARSRSGLLGPADPGGTDRRADAAVQDDHPRDSQQHLHDGADKTDRVPQFGIDERQELGAGFNVQSDHQPGGSSSTRAAYAEDLPTADLRRTQ
jgi:hypothetical protein